MLNGYEIAIACMAVSTPGQVRGTAGYFPRGAADVSKFDPSTIAPISTPFMLAPSEFIVFCPFPTIWMNRKPEFRPIGMLLLDMPAIALSVANYVG